MKRGFQIGRWHLLAIFVVLLVPFLVYRVGFYFHRIEVTPTQSQVVASVKGRFQSIDKNPRIPVSLSRVIDADTLEVRFSGGEKHRVQLLGVNGPEVWEKKTPDSSANSKANSDEVWIQTKDASVLAKRDRLAEFLKGKSLSLEFDSVEEPVDRYGRLLAWVWVETGKALPNGSSTKAEGEILLNEWVLREGVCVLRDRDGNLKYSAKLKSATKHANAHEPAQTAEN